MMQVLHRIVQAVWLACMIGMMWFAFAPESMGGLGGAGFHAIAFVVLGVLTPFAFPRVNPLLVWLALGIVGGVIEIGQELSGAGRYGDWYDFFIDVLAAGWGIYAAIAIRWSWQWLAVPDSAEREEERENSP